MGLQDPTSNVPLSPLQGRSCQRPLRSSTLAAWLDLGCPLAPQTPLDHWDLCVLWSVEFPQRCLSAARGARWAGEEGSALIWNSQRFCPKGFPGFRLFFKCSLNLSVPDKLTPDSTQACLKTEWPGSGHKRWGPRAPPCCLLESDVSGRGRCG